LGCCRYRERRPKLFKLPQTVADLRDPSLERRLVT
jgi:hypothetical protein